MDSKDGSGDQRVSVVQYFKNMYAVEVTKPRLPCIQVSEASSGTPLSSLHYAVRQEVLHPARVCPLGGLEPSPADEAFGGSDCRVSCDSFQEGELDDQLTNRMIKVAAMPPKDRSMAILGWRKELAHETQTKIADWGLQVSHLVAGHQREEADILGQSLHGPSQGPYPRTSSYSLRPQHGCQSSGRKLEPPRQDCAYSASFSTPD